MRARLHPRGRHLGFFREGTHDLCDARSTRQLLPATCDVLDRLGEMLESAPSSNVREVEVAENVAASERVVHLDAAPAGVSWPSALERLGDGLTGVMAAVPSGCRVLLGSPHVTDLLEIGASGGIRVRRHVLAFFQGNRFLLRSLVEHVT